MGILTDDMRRMVDEQQLGFIATVCPDGTPNLSTKGTTAAWDDEHLVFADICSPGTIANLRHNPVLEINVVDSLLRKGYRFKGTATILSEGSQFDEIIEFYRRRGSTTVKHHIVLVKIECAAPLISPVYDMGHSETQVSARWRRYWEKLWDQRTGLDTAIKGRVQRGVDLAPYPRRFFPGRCRSISPDVLPLVRGTMLGEAGVQCSCSRFGAVLEDERKVTGKPTYFTAVVVVVM